MKIKLLILALYFATINVPTFGQEILQEVTVNPGDTMWSIANKYLKDPQKWPELVKANNLPTVDPTLAIPGSKIKIPVLLIKEEYRSAQLVKMIPEVRYKRKGEADWFEAKPNMTLKYEDSLRTMKGGEARVKFPSKEIVQINENSYVVLKPEKILQEVQLLQGDIRASRAKVIMPGGTVVKPRSASSDFQARVREDETEVVFVYKGEVNVTAQGKTVTVREGFGTEVPKSAPPKAPMPLSNFKDFDPKEMTTEAPRKSMPQPKPGGIKFTPPTPSKTEKPKEGTHSKSVVAKDIIVNYTLQLAKDSKFNEIVLTKTEAIGVAFDIQSQPIPDGNYFMRVAFIDALGTRGQFSIPNTLTKDTVAPVIENVIPQDGQKFMGEESYCDVMGTVKGATLVAVNEDVVFLSQTGRFNKTIYLKEGVNKVKVVARDGQGNETVVERKISYSKSR